MGREVGGWEGDGVLGVGGREVDGREVGGRGVRGTIFNFLLRREEEGRLGRDLTGQRSRNSKQTTFYKI